jgi:hypothetical protein
MTQEKRQRGRPRGSYSSPIASIEVGKIWDATEELKDPRSSAHEFGKQTGRKFKVHKWEGHFLILRIE